MPSACHGQGNQVCGPLPLHLSEAPAGDHCSGPRVFAFCVCVVRETESSERRLQDAGL